MYCVTKVKLYALVYNIYIQYGWWKTQGIKWRGIEVNEQIFPTTSLWLTIGTIIFMFWTEESLVYNIFWIWKHQRFNWNVYWRKNICWWIGRETNHCDKTFKMVYIVFCKYMKSIMFYIILKIYPARLVSCIIICCLDCWIHERIFL